MRLQTVRPESARGRVLRVGGIPNESGVNRVDIPGRPGGHRRMTTTHPNPSASLEASGATLDLLREIRDELRGLRADLRRSTAKLTRADRRKLLKLLPVITAAIGSDEFILNEVMERTPVQLVLDGLTAK